MNNKFNLLKIQNKNLLKKIKNKWKIFNHNLKNKNYTARVMNIYIKIK